MFLNEKGIDFDGHIVNLPGQETQSPWYLKINPKGEVPAFKHGDKIISGSDNIMEYIEEHNLGKRSLIPKDSAEAKKHKYWMSKLETLPIGPLTYGTAYHPNIRKVKKGPIIGSQISRMTTFMDNRSAILRQKAAENAGTPAEAVLLAKAETHDKEHYLFSSEVEYKRMLKEMNETLDEIESELESHEEKPWLTGDCFTQADCILAVSLNRLHWLGHEDYVINDKRPLVTQYWYEVQAREEFEDSTYVPNLALYMLKDIIKINSQMIFGYTLLPIVAGLVYCVLKSYFPQ
jgi:glutathione S-transferase